jgi:hypothetical protein
VTVKPPRSINHRRGDDPDLTLDRIMSWARDVTRFLRAQPRVEYPAVTIPSAADRFIVADGRPRSVTVAQVLSGTATGAPGITWEPERQGFRVTALHGFSGDARLVLRVEV